MSIQAAQAAYQRGDLPEVRRIVDEILRQNPQDEQAWVLRMMIAETPDEKREAMMQVLAINPQSSFALQVQEQLPPESAPPVTETPPPVVEESGGVRVEEVGVYEMLWDCEFCGSVGLLGKTHRFCPTCGAQQNPNKRYFPADDQKVLVKDHVYYGADITCAACNTLNSANAEFCGNCGAPLKEGKVAATLGERSAADGETFASSGSRDLVKERFEEEQARIHGQPKAMTKPKKSWRNTLIGSAVATVVAACLGLCGLLAFWTNQETVVVSGHSWERVIEIQQFRTVSEGDWCDSLPSGARVTSRSERQRSTRSVPDGETCTNRQIDNGDGTFRQVRECRTNYRQEPVYDTYCNYNIDRWTFDRSATTSGGSLADTPYWAQVSLRTGSGLGAEREGGRKEKYTVLLRAGDGKTYECDFDDMNQWRGFPMESRWFLEVGVIAGDARCDSLKPAS